MNWDALGAIAELTAALGVIVSLLYVGVQIRQNSKIVVANAVKEVADTSREWFTYLIEDPELQRIFYVGAEDPGELSETEFMRFTTLMFTYLKHIESIHYQYHSGLLTRDLWTGWDYQTRQYLGAPGIQKYWKARRNSFSKSFQNYVDNASTDPNFRRAQSLARSVSTSSPPGE